MKSDALKKHHFWIVSGVSLLLVLLAFVMLSGGVSEAIEKEAGAIKTAANEAKGANAPGKVALDAIEDQKKQLEAKKDELWKANWDNQKKFFTWPTTSDNAFAAYNDMKFGENINKDFSDYKADIFRREGVYKALYEKMATSIEPTKFTGGWAAVLGERFIDQWTDKKPDSKQLWLAMEDVWVTRAMLEPIRIVNDSVANFKYVPTPGDTPLKRKFVSPVWAVDFDIVPDGPNKLIKAKLENLTQQMQILGNGSTMTLKLWVDPNMDLPPVEFKVEGEFVPGVAAITVAKLPSHVIPPNVAVTEIVKVQQVLDDRTVPIRELAKLSLGFTTGREARMVKLPPTFWTDEMAAGTADPNAVAGGVAPPPAAGASSGASIRVEGMGMGRGGAMPPPGIGIVAAPGAATAVKATLTQAVDDNRKRYLEVNSQLRRMPVAIKLILDQRYMQDVMVAYTNSPLRMQITRFEWVRFRGTLTPTEVAGATPGTPAASGTPGTPPASSGATDVAVGASLGADFGRMARGGGNPAEGGFIRGGAAPPQAAASGFIPGLTGGSLASVSDAQANSGLIELYLFGIVTLYEKFEVKKDPNAPAAAPAPTPAAPASTTPADAPKDPAKPENPMPMPTPAATPKL